MAASGWYWALVLCMADNSPVAMQADPRAVFAPAALVPEDRRKTP
jgi:hypothetical protein